MYSLRWFRSRPISSPYAKTIGAVALVAFLSGFIGLLPWTVRWRGVIPSEGLLGRIVADALIHYFNVVGAYLICVAVIAVALYLSTAFSFGAVQIWSQTRFGFVYAALDRLADWRMERARKKAAQGSGEEARRRGQCQAGGDRAAGTEALHCASRGDSAAPQHPRRATCLRRAAERPSQSGIERMFEGEDEAARSSDAQPEPVEPAEEHRGHHARRQHPAAARPPCRALPAASSCRRPRCCTVPTSTAPSTNSN